LVPPFRRSRTATGRRRAATLREAIAYLAKTVPKAEQALPEVLALRAIHRNKTRAFNPDRKDTHWGKRKLKQDE
jgi:hypothetical protein